jgi:hypothetical protein
VTTETRLPAGQVRGGRRLTPSSCSLGGLRIPAPFDFAQGRPSGPGVCRLGAAGVWVGTPRVLQGGRIDAAVGRKAADSGWPIVQNKANSAVDAIAANYCSERRLDQKRADQGAAKTKPIPGLNRAKRTQFPRPEADGGGKMRKTNPIRSRRKRGAKCGVAGVRSGRSSMSASDFTLQTSNFTLPRGKSCETKPNFEKVGSMGKADCRVGRGPAGARNVQNEPNFGRPIGVPRRIVQNEANSRQAGWDGAPGA